MHAAVKQIETHGFELTTRGQHLGDLEGDSRNPFLYPSAQKQSVVNLKREGGRVELVGGRWTRTEFGG